MKQIINLFANCILAANLSLMLVESVSATPYSYKIDRFEVTGNIPGYFLDEFDDDTLAPAWEVDFPTASESEGVVTLSSPGDSGPPSLINDLLIAIEDTGITSTDPGPLVIQDGAGDFTGTSTWLPTPPAKNEQFLMNILHETGLNVSESINIGITNPESSIATALGLPTGGILVFFGLESVDIGSVDFQGFLIDPMDITDSILLELSFDDTSNQFNSAFSLDGGITFQNPFTPISFNAGDSTFRWDMHAMALRTIPEPSIFVLLGTGLIVLASREQKYRGHQ